MSVHNNSTASDSGSSLSTSISSSNTDSSYLKTSSVSSDNSTDTKSTTSLVTPSTSKLENEESSTSLVLPTTSKLRSSSSLSTSSLEDSSSSSIPFSSSFHNNTSTSGSKSYHSHGSSSSIRTNGTSFHTHYSSPSSNTSNNSSSWSFTYPSSSSSLSTDSSSSRIPSSSTTPSSSGHSSSSLYITTFSSSTYLSSSSLSAAAADTAAPIYATPSSSSLISETTYFYSQVYALTDASTTITTELPTSTVFDSHSSVVFPSIVTADLASLRNSVQGYSFKEGSHSSKTGTIAGSVVGSVVGVSIALVIIWFLFFRKRASKFDSEKGTFSHAISSTRKMTPSDYRVSDDQVSGLNLGNFWTKLRSSINNNNNPHPLPPSPESTESEVDNVSRGLFSLRSSILSGQKIPGSIPRARHILTSQTSYPIASNSRTIDTVYEETESEPSIRSTPGHRGLSGFIRPKPRELSSRRFNNAGLSTYLNDPGNPFDDSSSSAALQGTKRRTPPPPPPPRRRGAAALNGNRASLDSIASSVISEDTDTASSDSSFNSFHIVSSDRNRNNRQAGFFREIV